MTDYICPACSGGFPGDDFSGQCPWCGFRFGDTNPGTPDGVARSIDHTVTYTVERDESENEGMFRLLRRLFT